MTQNKKKIVWITGGGTGIGKELAKNFCDRNFRVIISGRRLKKLKDVQKFNKTNYYFRSISLKN